MSKFSFKLIRNGLISATIIILSATVSFALTSYTADAKNNYQFPKPLDKNDVKLYQKIFIVQEKGNWRKANRLIKKLSNKLLLGHIQAQRYLHPTRYRSRYKELAIWLDKYADHPDARRIYKRDN